MVVPLICLINTYKKMPWCMYMGMYGTIQLMIYVISLSTCYYNKLPTASAMIVSCEMARMSMKTHAYFREKVVIGCKLHLEFAKFIPGWAKRRGQKESDLDLPEIDVQDLWTEYKRFLYYHFSPTLVYRDSYVRTKHIRFDFVIKNIATFIILIFY